MTEESIIYPRASNFNSIQDFFNHISNSRDACDKRGYHRVSSEPAKEDENMICYDCDLWFDKNFAKSCSLEYKVEPL